MIGRAGVRAEVESMSRSRRLVGMVTNIFYRCRLDQKPNKHLDHHDSASAEFPMIGRDMLVCYSLLLVHACEIRMCHRLLSRETLLVVNDQ